MDLGGQASNQGNLEAAYAYYEQALEVGRSEGRFWPIINGLLMLNSIAIRQRQFLAALAFAQEAFIVAQEHDHPEFMALSLFQVAFANIALGIIEAALNPLREITSMIQAANAPVLGLGLAGCMSYLYLKTDRAEKGAELYSFVEGRPLPYNWIHYANLLEEELWAALGTEAFMTASTHGKLLELDTVVAEIIAELQA